MVVFGLYHGLVALPVLLSILERKVPCCRKSDVYNPNDDEAPQPNQISCDLKSVSIQSEISTIWVLLIFVKMSAQTKKPYDA